MTLLRPRYPREAALERPFEVCYFALDCLPLRRLFPARADAYAFARALCAEGDRDAMTAHIAVSP